MIEDLEKNKNIYSTEEQKKSYMRKDIVQGDGEKKAL